MFDLFKSKPDDVKGIRNALVQLIKEQLQKAEGGEGANIKGLTLFITSSHADRHLYEAALYIGEEDRFKLEEVQKIADDYAINLPQNWTFDVDFIPIPPPEAIPAKDIAAAIFISTQKKPSIHKTATAQLKILNGQAEQATYTLESKAGKITIGREHKAKMADGFYRENIIAFPGDTHDQSNRSVSRQHAHIEWDGAGGFFSLYADEGGIPPHNKTKVRRPDGSIEKIQTIEIGHRLQTGDQIMLGEGAVLEFMAQSEEKTT